MRAPPDIAQYVWRTKYRAPDEASLRDSQVRVARALATVEGEGADLWTARFADLMVDLKFIPGGRILAGAGRGRAVTLLNCFVMGPIDDSIPGIFRALKESALTLQQGGGVGLDFSSLRPFGAPAESTGGVASGPVSFMRLWDAMSETLLSTGARRGAMMGTLRCDHPDIEAFVDAKRAKGRLTHFNLSVQITDAFMAAERRGEPWALSFGKRPAKTVAARDLWGRILRAAYDSAEPGVLFIDRINQLNPLRYCESISATNPCGEVPLPPYGACDLGSFNLVRFVRDPFTAAASLDLEDLARLTPAAVRLLDNVIDTSHFPLPEQQTTARGTRRIGIGVTGLADAIVMLGLDYGQAEAREVAQSALRTLCHAAYRASFQLAREKGAFPAFDRDAYLAGPFVSRLPEDIRDGIARHGLRNSHLIAIAPAGSISLMAGNVSSGVEPIFAPEYRREVVTAESGCREFRLTDYALAKWRAAGRGGVPPHLTSGADITAKAQLEMQAALQPFVDNAISKTVSVPPQTSFEAFRRIYDLAYDLGLKGCTAFRPNAATGAVLAEVPAPPCCPLRARAGLSRRPQGRARG